MSTYAAYGFLLSTSLGPCLISGTLMGAGASDLLPTYTTALLILVALVSLVWVFKDAFSKKFDGDGFSLVLFAVLVPVAITVCASLWQTTVLTPRRCSTCETGAIGSLKRIGTGQSLFREGDQEKDGNFDYGTLDELVASGLLDRYYADGTRNGYVFEVSYGATTSEFIWYGTARPAPLAAEWWNLSARTYRYGDRYFVTNHEGVTFYGSTEAFELNTVNGTIPEGLEPVGR